MNEAFARAYVHGIVLAPLAGWSDSAFRIICREMGATAVVTEMVAAAGLSRRSVKTNRLLAFRKEEKPIGVQLFGKNPEDFVRASALVSSRGFDFIDINAGCPVRKVVRNGSGAALLGNIPLLAAIVAGVRSETRLPVTVKIRLGWSPKEPVPGSLPSILADSGASALAIHGRYASDMFAGNVRVGKMAELVSASPLPVVVNGDVKSRDDSERLLNATGGSGVMVGRGALGNPWIFRSLASGVDYRPCPEEVADTIRRQFRMMSEYVHENRLHHIIRGWLVHYLKGFDGAAELRRKAVKVSTGDDLENLLGLLLERLKILESMER